MPPHACMRAHLHELQRVYSYLLCGVSPTGQGSSFIHFVAMIFATVLLIYCKL